MRSVGPGTHPSAGLQARYAADENQQCNLYVRYAFVVSDPYIDHDNIQSILVRDVRTQRRPTYWLICTLQSHWPPIPHLHTALNVALIRDFIYHLTDNFFSSCSAHPNPLVRSIGNYTLADLHRQYKKYTHKRPKHLL
jgi:hypothetical protein